MNIPKFISIMILLFAVEAFAQSGEGTPLSEPASSGLLPVKEGDFKYARIPEIRLSAPVKEKADDLVRVNKDADTIEEEGSEYDENRSSGFFGMSIKAANIGIKVLVVLLVIGLFALYKVRSSKKRHKVFFTKRRK